MQINLRTDIERAQKKLNISLNDFKPLSLNIWSEVQEKIELVFIKKKEYKLKHSRYWENFKLDSYGIQFDKDPFQQLEKLVCENELLWFFVNETINETTKYWFYEGHIQAIQQIIGETIGLDEYYIGSKKYEWLLCTNHHNIIVGIGESLTAKMKKLKNK